MQANWQLVRWAAGAAALATALFVGAAGAAYADDVPGAVSAVPAAPAVSGGTVEAGFTAEGHAYLGRPDAPLTLEEWSDYACPFCGRHFRQTFPGLLEKYVRTGQVKLVFRDLPLDGLHPTAILAHVAARCAARGKGETYWAYHHALFEQQAAWSRLPDPGEFLAATARKLGADLPAFEACIAAGEEAKFVTAEIAAGRILEYNGTPQFRFLRGTGEPYELSGAQPASRFEAIIGALLSGKDPPPEAVPESAQPGELPAWAKRSGLAPDPGRPGYTVAGDAYRGDPKAPVVVVEFSDFQCAACRKHALEVQPAIDAALVDTGQVRWVSKHLPLRIHPQAVLAAVAAECAGEQGRFWEMRRKLFESTERWANERAESELPAIAATLDLDRSAFARCFDGRKALERVLADLYDAKGVVERTPTFVILNDDKSGSISGPLPADPFIGLLRNRVAGATAAP